MLDSVVAILVLGPATAHGQEDLRAAPLALLLERTAGTESCELVGAQPRQRRATALLAADGRERLLPHVAYHALVETEGRTRGDVSVGPHEDVELPAGKVHRRTTSAGICSKVPISRATRS